MITYEVFAGAEVAADVYDALAKILRWVADSRIWLVSLTSATLPLVQPPWAGGTQAPQSRRDPRLDGGERPSRSVDPDADATTPSGRAPRAT